MTAQWSDQPSQRLSIGDASLEYACFGPPPTQAPTLVLLHEGLGCTELWRDVPQRLAQETGMGVVAYSRAGYGRSSAIGLPRPLDYMSIHARDVLGKVLSELGVKQCILLGHSDGATIAAVYAGSVSDQRVRGLILIAPHFFAETSGIKAIKTSGRVYEAGGLKSKLAKYHDHPDQAFYGWHNSWTHPDFEAWDVADSIDHWRIPVLAIQGQDDPYGSAAQIDEIETRIYSPLEIAILEECGHAPHFEKTDQTCAAITDFCATLLRLERSEVAIEPT